MKAEFTFADGKTVNRLGYGAMRLTGQPGNFGPYEDWDAGKALLRAAREAGVQFFDSARAYGPGWNERLIAEALGPYDSDLLIATKGGIDKDGPTPAHIRRDGRPESLRQHIEQSLQDLRTEQIGLYYLHAPDTKVPLQDSMGALEAARQRGEIARIGISNVTLEQLETAMDVAPIAAVQNRYDPVNGGDEAVLDYTAEHGIAFVPWGPLGANPMKPGSPFTGERAPSVADALTALLERAPNVLPIPGTRSIEHMLANVGVLKRLS